MIFKATAKSFFIFSFKSLWIIGTQHLEACETALMITARVFSVSESLWIQKSIMWTDATKLLGFMVTGISQTFKFNKVNPQICTFIYNNKLIYIHENANTEIKAWWVIKIAF